MELTDALLAQIGAYLTSRMSDPERQAFETQIRADADLQREVMLQHQLQQGLALLTEKQRFKRMHTDLMQRGLLPPQPDATTPATDKILPLPVRPAIFRPIWNAGTVAASLVLLAGIGWFVVSRRAMSDPATIQRDKAFYAAFTPDLRSAPRLPADPDRLGAALPDPTSHQDSIRVQQGVGLLQNQRLLPAIARLRPIAQGLPGHWRASAQWFLALAYLRNGQTTQTDSLLTLIAETNGHPYQLDALHLTSRLPHLPASRP